LVFIPALLVEPKSSKLHLDYLALSWFFVALLVPWFTWTHPQPQVLFFSAIFITSFTWIQVGESGSSA